ncbi:MAG: CD225/dispanin family protein [Phormidesmis sp.]
MEFGIADKQDKQETKAIEAWTAAIAYCSSYSRPYYHRALLLIEQREQNRALFDLDAAITAEPTLAAAYLQRGNLRAQMGDTAGAAIDWQYAVCNDFTLDSAKHALETVRQETYNAQLTQVLAAPLSNKKLSANVQRRGDCLEIHVHRAVGTGVNYYTLPNIIKQYLEPLQLTEINRFQLIGRAGELSQPDWNQSYDLYKNYPCPPSHWQVAISTIFLFPPFAIPAFIQALRVKHAYKQGKYVQALEASKLVKIIGIASSLPFSFFILLVVICTGYHDTKAPLPLKAIEPETIIAKWLRPDS